MAAATGAGAALAERRFSPPTVAVPAELEWLLGRALGPPGRSWPGVSGEAVLALADRVLLGSLAARRTPAADLERELGSPAAARLDAARRNDAAVQVQYRATCRLLAELAASAGHPVVFVKGMALQLAGLVAAGDRPVADVDALVPPDAAVAVQRALIERGFRHGAAVAMRHPHHLPPLWSERWLGVEVHDRLAGVSLRPEAGSASADELLAAGLVRPVAGMPAAAMVTAPALTAAHLVAHALAHHPESEAFFFRLLADLAAVVAAAGEEEVVAAGRHVAWLVAPAELRAVLDLVAALARAEPVADLARGDGAAAVILRHFVALAVDPGYRRRVGRSRLILRDDPSDLGDRRRLPRLWWRRRDVLGPDGRPLPWPRYLAWSVARPLRLVGRVVTSFAGLDDRP